MKLIFLTTRASTIWGLCSRNVLPRLVNLALNLFENIVKNPAQLCCPTNNPKRSNVEKNMSNQMWISEYFHELLFCFMQMHASTYCRWHNTLVFSQMTAGGNGLRSCKDSWEDDWEQVNININTREFEGGLRGRSLKGHVVFSMYTHSDVSFRVRVLHESGLEFWV